MFNTKASVSTCELIARDGWQCAYCQRFLTADMMTVDHVIPTLRGGPDTLGNTVISCRACNARKGDMNLIEYRHWLAVRRYAFVIAPHEALTFEPVEMAVDSSYTTIALYALWSGVRKLDDKYAEIIESAGGLVVEIERAGEYMDVCFLDGVLFEYYNWKRSKC